MPKPVYDDDDEYEDDEDYEEQAPPAAKSEGGRLRKELEKQIKRAKEAEAKAVEAEARIAAMERRSAFSEAGVPGESKIADLFRKTYEGDLTADAIKTAWSDLQAELTGSQPEQQVEQQPSNAPQGGTAADVLALMRAEGLKAQSMPTGPAAQNQTPGDFARSVLSEKKDKSAAASAFLGALLKGQ